jgi:hypothetical protein
MTSRRNTILVAVAALVVSLLSHLFLFGLWFRGIIEGRTFSSAGGYISMLPALDSIPFAWPYFIAGFFFRRFLPLRPALFWALITGLVGAVLHAFVFHIQLVPDAALSSYVHSYSRLVSAPLLSAVGFLIAQLTYGARKQTI